MHIHICVSTEQNFHIFKYLSIYFCILFINEQENVFGLKPLLDFRLSPSSPSPLFISLSSPLSPLSPLLPLSLFSPHYLPSQLSSPSLSHLSTHSLKPSLPLFLSVNPNKKLKLNEKFYWKYFLPFLVERMAARRPFIILQGVH